MATESAPVYLWCVRALHSEHDAKLTIYPITCLREKPT